MSVVKTKYETHESNIHINNINTYKNINIVLIVLTHISLIHS